MPPRRQRCGVCANCLRGPQAKMACLALRAERVAAGLPPIKRPRKAGGKQLPFAKRRGERRAQDASADASPQPGSPQPLSPRAGGSPSPDAGGGRQRRGARRAATPLTPAAIADIASHRLLRPATNRVSWLGRGRAPAR